MLYNETPNNMSVKTQIRDLKDNYYLSVKATLNRCGFRMDLKLSRYNLFLIYGYNSSRMYLGL